MKTIKETAAALGVCRQRVMDMVHAGQLETRPNPYRTGGILITEAAIAARKRAKERWLKTRRADKRSERTDSRHEEAPRDSID